MAPTIAVGSYGVATTPAETARIQLLFGITLAPDSDSADGDTPVADVDDLQPVVRAIAEAGAEAENIDVTVAMGLQGYYSPGSSAGLVEVIVERPTTEGVAAIIDAAASAATATLYLQQVGVEYDVADCAALVDEARREAISRASGEAAALADGLGGSLGDVVQISTYAPYGSLYIDDLVGCPPSADYGYYGTGSAFDTPPFNPAAPAEVRFAIQLTVTFAYVPLAE
jgi:uncharacterized protein YggE